MWFKKSEYEFWWKLKIYIHKEINFGYISTLFNNNFCGFFKIFILDIGWAAHSKSLKQWLLVLGFHIIVLEVSSLCSSKLRLEQMHLYILEKNCFYFIKWFIFLLNRTHFIFKKLFI